MTTILIVDDDVALLASLGGQLERAGYQVLKASETTHAELLFADQRPDLVLLEVRTSREDGWGLLERFSAQVPVIVVSASGREEDVVRGLQAGAVDYLAKPYRSVELLARIRVRLEPQNLAPEHVLAVTTSDQPLSPVSAALPDELSPDAPPKRLSRATRRDGEGESEAVFMTEAEEMVLLRMGGSSTPATQDRQTPDIGLESDLSLGERLHAERQRRRLTLVQVENELKIRMSYLQAMEDNKFTLLPRGPLAAQMLRSYADYLSLDTAPLLEEFQRFHASEPLEPLPALGGPRLRRSLPRWIVPVSAVILALVVSIGGILMFDQQGARALVNNLRGLVVPQPTTPPPVPTAAPAPTAPPAATAAPTATLPAPTLTPTNIPTPEPAATPTGQR